MKAAIAGGGIAGLSAAIALRNEGWEVDVFEKGESMDSGIGNGSHHPSAPDPVPALIVNIGIAMGANALRLLESWGVTIEELKATPFLQERHLKEDTGEMIHFVDHSWNQGATGYQWLAMRRVHLYAALVRAARRTPESRMPIKIHTSNAATRVDCEAGKLWTEKGDEVEADVVVVADGVFSKLIYSIDPTAPPLIHHTTAFRMDLDQAGLDADDVLGPIWKNEASGFVALHTNDPRSLMLVVPPTADKLYALFMHPFLEAKNGSECRWDAEASMAEFVEATRDTSGIISRIVPLARRLVRWTLNVRDPVATFVRGRAVATGDAAHPQLPLHGQGATSAMEDGAALAVFLTSPKLKSEVIENRLQKWNEFRYGRACTVQTISINGGLPLESIIGRIRDDIGYGGPLPENVNLHERPVQEFFFHYDVRKEAEAFIEKAASKKAEVVATKTRVPQQRVDAELVHRL